MQVLLWLAGLAAAVVVVGALLPRRVTVTRSTVVAAGRDTLFPLIASFKRGWTKWSPFGPQRDPTVQLVYSGADHGEGAVQRWTSQKMGDGQMTMLRADPEHGVVYDLQMAAGKFRSGGQIDLSPDPAGTRVTWSSTIDLGRNPLMHYLGMMIRAGMGQAFDEGLNTLKREAEEPLGSA
ncbi:MAG TPA: SRPBCC family protein [Myxococcaceae bacterium]